MSNLKNSAVQFISLLMLAGCGGESFTSFGPIGAETDGGGATPDSGKVENASGGSAGVEVDGGNATGGATVSDSGGTTSTGGTSSTGGERNTGGTSTGGVTGTGGTAGSTGGALDTGGTTNTGGVTGAGGATVIPCNGAGYVTHNNGLGQTWQDCVPLNTYNEAQALKACAASSKTCVVDTTSCAGLAGYPRVLTGSFVAGLRYWGFSGTEAGVVNDANNYCFPPATPVRWN